MQPTSSPIATGVLASLRSRTPKRTLRPTEAMRIAELQANVLLEQAGIDDGPIDLDLITSLPRIRLAYEHDLPVSGAAHWAGGTWIITLNADEPSTRQRYSAFHEMKHIIDHPLVDLLYSHDGRTSAEQQRERIADYFSACVLMPKRIVKRYWGQGVNHPADLAAVFDVSERAMRFRLDQLGLGMTARCEQPVSYRRPRLATPSQFRDERVPA